MSAGWFFAQMSVRFLEVSIFSPAGIPVFPLKALIPVCGVFLFLQGIAEVLRCIYCLREGRWLARLHDVEELETVILHEQEYLREHGQAAPAKDTGARP
jgi:TRAP-type mannitol/chloroaromatic compound transport system permease small subunit